MENCVDSHVTRITFLGAPIDLDPPGQCIARLRSRKQGDAFVYVVTPNADHVVRLAKRPELLSVYDAAWMSWNDSRPIKMLGKLIGLQLPHLPGSDAVDRLFAEVLNAGDRLAVIGASDELAAALRQRFPQYHWEIHVPPDNLDNDPTAMSACMRFALEKPARFLFLGVGSPRSELLAQQISQQVGATGTALCIGAALEFSTGRKSRAPKIFQNLGMEWFYRLVTEPRRLWRRYVLGALPLAVLFAKELRRQ